MSGAGRRKVEGCMKDRVAKLMAAGLEPTAISDRLAVSRNYVYHLIKLIKQDLGWLGD